MASDDYSSHDVVLLSAPKREFAGEYAPDRDRSQRPLDLVHNAETSERLRGTAALDLKATVGFRPDQMHRFRAGDVLRIVHSVKHDSEARTLEHHQAPEELRVEVTDPLPIR